MSEANSNLIDMLKERYNCPYFRILVIGRANAGKTTILEKVCGVAMGTNPIVYHQDDSDLKQPLDIHLAPTIERGIHDIEDQITYPGSNFIFHDSQGFEAGDNKELEDVWKFIERRSASTTTRQQLHMIWYCIPMEGSRPIQSEELKFFTKGIGEVPLVAIFTKFDAQIIKEYVQLNDMEDDGDKWYKAKENAEDTFQRVYLPKVMKTGYPPKTYVHLEDMDMPETDCHELTAISAAAIDDPSLNRLFVSTQMNNLDLCVKSAVKFSLGASGLDYVVHLAFNSFPHYWFQRTNDHVLMKWEDRKERSSKFSKGSVESKNPKDENTAFDDVDKKINMVGQLCDLFDFGEQAKDFSETPTCYQIIAASVIIAKKSFWIKKPLIESIPEAFNHFKKAGSVDKLKARIKSEYLPHDHQDLIEFLYDIIKDF